MTTRMEARRTGPERDVLVEANIRLVWHVAHRTHEKTVRLLGTRDDVASTGVLGLIRAAELWDETRGIAFSSYAVRSIKSAIHNAKGSQICRKRWLPSISFSALLRGCGNENEPAVLAVASASMEREELLALLRRARRKLKPADRKLLRQRYTEQLGLKAIGETLGGVTKERARQRIAKAIERLAEIMRSMAPSLFKE